MDAAIHPRFPFTDTSAKFRPDTGSINNLIRYGIDLFHYIA